MENTTTLHPAPTPLAAPRGNRPVVSTTARKRKLLDQVSHAIRTLN